MIKERRKHCSRCGARIPFQPWSTCASCRAYWKRRNEAEREFGNYTPIDEWLRRPSTRVLRALRFFDWISIADFIDDVDICRSERGAFEKVFQRLHAAGKLERRVARTWTGAVFEYRLKRGVRLEPPNDEVMVA